MLGSEKLVHYILEGKKIVAKLSSDKEVLSGKEIILTPDISKILVFDPETGKRFKAF